MHYPKVNSVTSHSCACHYLTQRTGPDGYTMCLTKRQHGHGGFQRKIWQHVNIHVISSFLRVSMSHLKSPCDKLARGEAAWVGLCTLVMPCQHKSLLPAIGELMLCYAFLQLYLNMVPHECEIYAFLTFKESSPQSSKSHTAAHKSHKLFKNKEE